MRLLDHSELVDRGIKLGERQLRRLEAAGDFPRRVKVSRRRVAWVEAEVVAWCEARAAARRAA